MFSIYKGHRNNNERTKKVESYRDKVKSSYNNVLRMTTEAP